MKYNIIRFGDETLINRISEYHMIKRHFFDEFTGKESFTDSDVYNREIKLIPHDFETIILDFNRSALEKTELIHDLRKRCMNRILCMYTDMMLSDRDNIKYFLQTSLKVNKIDYRVDIVIDTRNRFIDVDNDSIYWDFTTKSAINGSHMFLHKDSDLFKHMVIPDEFNVIMFKSLAWINLDITVTTIPFRTIRLSKIFMRDELMEEFDKSNLLSKINEDFYYGNFLTEVNYLNNNKFVTFVKRETTYDGS